MKNLSIKINLGKFLLWYLTYCYSDKLVSSLKKRITCTLSYPLLNHLVLPFKFPLNARAKLLFLIHYEKKKIIFKMSI